MDLYIPEARVRDLVYSHGMKVKEEVAKGAELTSSPVLNT
jgi:hypothetical protein